ncbi:hypothetical protein ACP70R_030503 [Stipagrostis hirtigluma subsp. patula]
MATKQLSMKLLFDSRSQKVCFADAGNDVVEFLSCLLCLPLSTVVNLLTKERMGGSIGNILDSVEKLDSKYLISSKSKEPYLSPTVAPTALCPLQKLLDAPLNANFSCFTCEGKANGDNGTHVTCGYFSAIKGTRCPHCSNPMDKAMPHTKADGFVGGTATYAVKDDLSIIPASSVSCVTLLAQCGVQDVTSMREQTVKIGKEEALRILLASLKSKTVLTDVFLEKEDCCKKEISIITRKQFPRHLISK